MKTALVTLLASLVFIVTAFSAIRGPGKYSGVVVFDRWGGCYLYSGVYLMAVSEKVKESLSSYQGKPVLIDAQEVFQPINPGDGLITKLKVLGPAEESSGPQFNRPPDLEWLRLTVAPNFSPQGPDELIIQLGNDGTSRLEIETDALAPTLLAKKQGLECFEPADGSSYAAVTRNSVATLYKRPGERSCLVNGKGRTVKLSLVPGTAIPARLGIEPGQSVEIPLQFQLSPGEYEFLAGYGGGVHHARALASNQFGFDIDEAGKAHLAKGATVSTQTRPPRRVTTVCGRVTLEDGNPAGKARVILWPSPFPKERPRAANTVLADADGWFRMESVLEGQYILAATHTDAGGVRIGALGGRHAADASALSVVDSASGCSSFLTIRRVPGYTLRGRTTPDGDPSSGPRTVRMIMTQGDAFPFETSAAVQPDGRFEFRNVPAGKYQFFAGWTGWADEVASDRDDIDVETRWPSMGAGVVQSTWSNGHYEQRTLGAVEGNEYLMISALKELHRAQRSYAEAYKMGFVVSLNFLGPAPEWYRATADRADLVDERKAGLLPRDGGTHFTESGYLVTYSPGPVDDHGKILTYKFSARPIEFGKTGVRSFFMDDGGIIHATEANRSPTQQDPAVEE